MEQADVKALADTVLTPLLRHAGFVSADIDSKPEVDEENDLYLTLHFKPGAELVSGLTYLDPQVAVQDALKQSGDRRFPHFRYDYPDDPAPFDAEEVFGSQ